MLRTLSLSLVLLGPTNAAAGTCYSLVDRGEDLVEFVTFAPEIGSLSVVLSSPELSISSVAGLAVLEDTGYLCADGGLRSISLLDGSVDALLAGCMGIGPAADGVVFGQGAGSPLELFAAGAGFDGRWASPVVSFEGTRLAGNDEFLYAMPHSGGMVDTYDFSDGAYLGSVGLESFYEWSWGLAYVDDALVVLTDGRGHDNLPHLLSFDPLTGLLLGDTTLEVEAGVVVRGLACGEQ